MKKLFVNKIGSVYRCPGKIIHIHCKGMALHFTEEAFEELSLLIKEANSKLMEINLAELLKEKKDFPENE